MNADRVFAIAALLFAASGLAWAHGEKHGTSVSVGDKEQLAWGVAGEAKSVKRTIDVRMTDQMRFVPDRIAVKQGETVRLRVRNDGKMLHEMVIGTKAVLEEHAAQMLKFPEMEHEAPYMAHVAPGKSEAIIWTFNRPGEFDFACLIAGHYQAGMVGKITVAQ